MRTMPQERAAGSTRRLDELYARHAPGAYSLAFLLTGDRHQAEDLAHEAFVRLVGRFRHLRHPEAFEAYLRRTLVNLHTSKLRRLKLEREHLARERSRGVTTAALPDVAGRQDLWAAVQVLPPRQRAAVVLRYYEDVSERETAETLGCSVAAVKSLVTRAMTTLRQRIGEEDR